MGDPIPYEPDDPDAKPDPAAPKPVIERADWLVGADDGIISDRSREETIANLPLEIPRLVRPVDPDADRPASSRVPLPFRTPSSVPATPAAPAAPSPTMPSWTPGTSSVPMVRRSPAPPAASVGGPIPELSRDFPMDDAEERARVAAQLAEQQAREAAIAARPHEVVKPQEFEIPAVPLPWWSSVPELIKTDRRVHIGALVLVVLLAVVAFWPRSEKTISVAHLKEHPARYADQQVRVGGRVAEVFPVGGSVAYTLVQGRDTIVVFSRVRTPKPREKVIVVGTLSTGYLGGETRTAIFEATR